MPIGYDPSTKAQALALVAVGHSQAKICEQLGMGHASLTIWIRRAKERGWGGRPFDLIKMEHVTDGKGSEPSTPQKETKSKSVKQGNSKKRAKPGDDGDAEVEGQVQRSKKIKEEEVSDEEIKSEVEDCEKLEEEEDDDDDDEVPIKEEFESCV